MNTEFTIDINGTIKKIYMQSGFIEHNDMHYPLHKHAFAEMHILLCGKATLKCDGEEICLNTSDALIVPANIQHKYQSFTKDAKRITFFIDDSNKFNSLTKTTIPKVLLALLCEEIKEYVLAGRDSKLRALLSYICSDFSDIKKEKNIIPITNRELIMENFFSQNYNRHVTVDDLAKEVMLSKKQTEREVKRITGNTFGNELAKRRIHAASILSQTTDLSLAEISELVGYATYCGFYKTYKKVLNCSPNIKQ